MTLLAGCAAAPSPPPPPPTTLAPAATHAEPDLVPHEREATSAYEHKHFALFLARSEELLAAAPGEPRRVYNVACGQSLSGKPELAIRSLQSLAQGYVYFDIAADTDFAPLASASTARAATSRFSPSLPACSSRASTRSRSTGVISSPPGTGSRPIA
jgi:hypothetical protein